MDTEPVTEESAPAWTYPKPRSITVDSDNPPKLIAKGSPSINPAYPDNFFRSAKWCPDGAVALAQCEDRSLQILKVPESTLLGEADYDYDEPGRIDVTPVFPQAAPIVDYAWYPGATSREPSTYCFVASVRDCPVKLLDATDGRLRASYKIVDHRERFVAPHCMAFNPLSTQLYCGFENAIEVFDVQRPGEGSRLSTTPSKKSKDGMKGIVSSLAFCTDYSGLYAASSLTAAISLYSESDGEAAVGVVEGVRKPVLQVQFNPAKPHLLYASQRRSSEILCWDIRSSYHILQTFERPASSTNQKLRFDIDMSGKWLVAGDENGDIHFFDQHVCETAPTYTYHAHDDAVGSVAFRLQNADLLSVSGSRHFHSSPVDVPSDDSESESESEEDSSPPPSGSVRLLRQRKRPFATDASATLWRLSEGTSSAESDSSGPLPEPLAV